MKRKWHFQSVVFLSYKQQTHFASVYRERTGVWSLKCSRNRWIYSTSLECMQFSPWTIIWLFIKRWSITTNKDGMHFNIIFAQRAIITRTKTRLLAYLFSILFMRNILLFASAVIVWWNNEKLGLSTELPSAQCWFHRNERRNIPYVQLKICRSDPAQHQCPVTGANASLHDKIHIRTIQRSGYCRLMRRDDFLQAVLSND